MNDLELARAVLPVDPAGGIFVKGKFYRYHLIPNHTTAIYDRDTMKHLGSACIQFIDYCPGYDRLVAEYLLIKNDERRYLNTANLSGVHSLDRRYYWIPVALGALAIVAAAITILYH